MVAATETSDRRIRIRPEGTATELARVVNLRCPVVFTSAFPGRTIGPGGQILALDPGPDDFFQRRDEVGVFEDAQTQLQGQTEEWKGRARGCRVG